MASEKSLANLRPRWGPSGNARGAHRGYRTTMRLCRVNSPEMAKTLIACAKDETAPWAARIAAANAVLDRAWGRPVAGPHEVTGNSDPSMPRMEIVDPDDGSETVTIGGSQPHHTIDGEAERDGAPLLPFDKSDDQC